MSDESMRKAGRAELDRLNGGAKKAAPAAPKERKRVETSYGDLMGVGKKKKLRRVDQEVSKAIDEAPSPKFD